MTAIFNWHKWGTGEFVQISEEVMNYLTITPKCPLCGQDTRESEGTIDQDEQGNDIEAYWYDCDRCEIQTQHWIID